MQVLLAGLTPSCSTYPHSSKCHIANKNKGTFAVIYDPYKHMRAGQASNPSSISIFSNKKQQHLDKKSQGTPTLL